MVKKSLYRGTNMVEGTIGVTFQGQNSTLYRQEKYLINIILLVKISPINIFFNSLDKSSNGDVKCHYYLLI